MVLVLTATLFICLLAHSYPQAWALPLHYGRFGGHSLQIKKLNWENLSQNKLVVGQWAAWPPVLAHCGLKSHDIIRPWDDQDTTQGSCFCLVGEVSPGLTYIKMSLVLFWLTSKWLETVQSMSTGQIQTLLHIVHLCQIKDSIRNTIFECRMEYFLFVYLTS